MPSYRSATSCNRAVRVASGITHDAMPSDGSRERKCIGTPVEAVPKAEKTQGFWRNQIRLLTALIFFFSGLVAVAGEAFAGSKGCENIVADLNGKDVGFLTKAYPNSDFHATDQLHIDLIRNPSFWESAYFNAFAGSGTPYIEASYDGGVVTGNESASFSGQDLVLGGIYVEAINYSQTTSPWRMDVVCVTKSNPLDAVLSGLTLSSGNLEPAFNTATTTYRATVANSVSTLGVTPSTPGTTATLKINGASAVSGASSAVPLNVGDNTLTVTVMTEDRTIKRTYLVVVTRAAPPTITSVAPYIGSTAGGQSVTITGTNFIGVSAVAFGGVPTTTFTVDSATRITAIAPARTAGPAEVTVTTVGNSSVTRANGFTYVAAPVVTAVKPLNTPARTYAIGATLLFDVDFDQRIAVSSGAPQLKAIFGSVARRINLIGSVFNTMTFSYKVAESDLDEDGIAISSMSLEGATVMDYDHLVNADVTLRNIADTSGIRIDGVRPTVASINPAATGTVFDVVFSEPVTAVDVGKFNLVKTGTAQGTIDSVSGSGSAYQVRMASVSGDGALALTLSTGTGIKDSAGNEMTGGFTGGTPMIVAPPSSDASLSDIGVSSGTLAPAFDAATTSYTVSVGNSVSAITVTPANAHPSAVVSVNGTVITAPGSLPVNLQVGDNAISIVVTAQDAVTKKTYDIVVNRAGAVPDAPTAVSAASGDGEATVSFTAPVNTGTTPISSYTVTADPGGAATTGGSSPITVNGLANGTAYTFKVTATNSIGPGPASNASNSVTPKPAPIANAVTATVAANSSANPITLSLSGGAADAVAIGTQPTHGTVSVSGLAITYTPTPGYSGSDSFTYTATNATGTSAAATVAITVSAPTLTFSPPAGALAGGTAATAYSAVTVAASAGTAPYVYAANGTLPDGLTLDPASGLISGTPTIAGRYNFTVTATDANNATGTAAYSIAIAVQAPTAGDVSTTVAANSSANPVPLNLSGGIADALAIGTQPTHGSASVSGLAITYTPTPGYSGSDSFTYTATNATGTSAAATVTITVTAPTFIFSPSAGTLTGGIVGTAYDVTLVASAGTAPYRYAVTSGALPAGLALDGITGRISGMPTTAGSYNFTVTATDANNATGTAGYSIAIVIQAPTANDVRATVAANSAANPITLDLTGGAADMVSVGAQPAHGIAAASGLAITYTPTPGYSGTDSFTYVATNATGTSTAATVAISVTAPTLTFSPPAGALASGIAGTAYSSATVTASAGSAPYRFAVTSGQLPAGLALDGATGAIAGTPNRAGNHDFTVTATDANNAAGTARYSITIAPAPVDFTFDPPAGALTDAMAGEDYSQPIAATGGAGPMLYRLASGALPKGMVLNLSTGHLTGPLSADAGGSYTFTIEVRDSNGATGTASYSVKVQARAITVTDKVVDVPAGSAPPDVYLNRGATGGPFIAAEATFVEPARAGTASIIQGELAQLGSAAPPVGWYLKFTPNKAYSGQVRVGFRMVSALGTSNTGTVTYNLAFDAFGHAAKIDALVRDFVRTRQNLIASTIKVPGLIDRRRMGAGTDAVTTRMAPSTDGVTLGFSTSLAQIEAARDRADGVDQTEASPFNIWLDGTFLIHRRKDDDGKWGNFGMVSLGADYLLSEKALLGLSFHYDRMTDPTDEDAELSGNGWLAGPYASFELGKGIFWDTGLLYGGSSNALDANPFDGTFDTRRFLLDTAVKGQWQLDDATVFTPALRAVYFSETVDDYGVRNGTGDDVDLKGFTEAQLRVSLGAEIARPFTLDNDRILTPKLGGTLGYSGLDGAGLFGSFSAALSLQTAESWSIDTGLLFNVEGDGETSAGAKVGVSGRF